MSPEKWKEVDSYLSEQFVPADPVLDAALAASDAAGLPAIQVAANQGKLLHLLTLMIGAKKILEIGTLGGYSTIWLARALPRDGKTITLEFDPKHADVARKNFQNAKLADRIEVRVGAALDTLPKLVSENAGPFDLVFIDADKKNIPDYFKWSMELTKPGSVIIVDNVIRDGAVTDPSSTDDSVRGVQHFNQMVAKNPDVTATAIQTVGSKGWDGFAIVRRKG